MMHDISDAKAPINKHKLKYHPSFASDLKSKTVIRDHEDEIFSVLGAPILKINDFSDYVFGVRRPNSLCVMTLSKFLLCFS